MQPVINEFKRQQQKTPSAVKVKIPHIRFGKHKLYTTITIKFFKYTNFGSLFIWLLVVNCRYLSLAADTCELDSNLDNTKLKNKGAKVPWKIKRSWTILHKTTNTFTKTAWLLSRAINPPPPWNSNHFSFKYININPLSLDELLSNNERGQFHLADAWLKNDLWVQNFSTGANTGTSRLAAWHLNHSDTETFFFRWQSL